MAINPGNIKAEELKMEQVQETDQLTDEQWQILYDAGIIVTLEEEIKPLTDDLRMILYDVGILTSLEEDPIIINLPSEENDKDAELDALLEEELNDLLCEEP